MKALLNNMGARIALKRLNRDLLAQSIGTTRQNLLTAVKARRPPPAAHAPPLRRALALDESSLLEPGRVHGSPVAKEEKQGKRWEQSCVVFGAGRCTTAGCCGALGRTARKIAPIPRRARDHAQ